MTAQRSWPLAMLLAALAMLGPFSIDTYLPAFQEIGQSLNASPIEMQQTLTAYMLSYSAMMLWHGSISDAIGRRRVILASLFVFAMATLGCAASYRIEYLLAFRVLQGLSAGAGLSVGRAIIRDRFHGAEAQKMLSQVTMLFSLAPGVAPILGGWLHATFGWHSIFLFVGVLAVLLLAACLRWLPETLPHHQRQSLAPHALARSYGELIRQPAFLCVVIAVSLNFSALFLYISSAPVFLTRHLGLSATQFGYLFVPAVTGIFLGGWLSGRLAGKLTPTRTVYLGYGAMFAAQAFNLTYHSFWPAALPWSIAPIALHTLGMSLAAASLTLIALDLYPQRRGLVSSLQACIQVGIGAVVAGVLAPLLFDSPLHLAIGAAVQVAVAFTAWLLYQRVTRSSH